MFGPRPTGSADRIHDPRLEGHDPALDASLITAVIHVREPEIVERADGEPHLLRDAELEAGLTHQAKKGDRWAALDPARAREKFSRRAARCLGRPLVQETGTGTVFKAGILRKPRTRKPAAGKEVKTAA